MPDHTERQQVHRWAVACWRAAVGHNESEEVARIEGIIQRFLDSQLCEIAAQLSAARAEAESIRKLAAFYDSEIRKTIEPHLPKDDDGSPNYGGRSAVLHLIDQRAKAERLREMVEKAEKYVYWLHAPCRGDIGPHATENSNAALSGLESALAFTADAKGIEK